MVESYFETENPMVSIVTVKLVNFYVYLRTYS